MSFGRERVRAVLSAFALTGLLLPGPAWAQWMSPTATVQLTAHHAPGARLDSALGETAGTWAEGLGFPRVSLNTPYTVTLREAGTPASTVLLVSSETGEVPWDLVLGRIDRVGLGAIPNAGRVLEVWLQPGL